MNKMKRGSKHAEHEVLRNLPYNLYIVAMQRSDGTDSNALVVSWLTQCSFEPPLLLLALRRDSTCLDILNEGKSFSINLIAREDQELARRFVKPSHLVGNKLEAGDCIQEKAGTPVLKQALAFVECRLVQTLETGDHVVVVGQVVNADRRRDGRVLSAEDLGWHYGG